MLRSKQLLPIYKGARIWLIAGTTRGTQNKPSDGNPNPNFDESRSELSCDRADNHHTDSFANDREDVDDPSSPSFKLPTFAPTPSNSNLLPWQRSASGETNSHVNSISKAASVYSSSTSENGAQINRTLAKNVAPSLSKSQTSDPQLPVSTKASISSSSGSSRKDSRFQRNVCREKDKEVGLAAISHLSHFETVHSAESDATRPVFQKPTSDPNLGTQLPRSSTAAMGRGPFKLSQETVSHLNVRDEKLKILQRDSSQTAAFHNGSRLISSVNSALPADHQQVVGRSKGILVIKDNANLNESVKDYCNGPVASTLVSSKAASMQQRTPLIEVKRLPKVHKGGPRGKDIEETNHTTSCGKDNYHNSKSSGARSGPGRMYQRGQRRDFHYAASSSKSKSTGEVVDSVCGILARSQWGHETVQALSDLGTNLSPLQVNEVLKQQRGADKALAFFNWAKEQLGYRHDVHTYTTMLGILGRARHFEALDHLLTEMQIEGCKPSVVTYNRLIHSYGRANYLEASQSIFNHMHIVGCKPDRVTYGTLIDLYAKAGFHDRAVSLYNMMQQEGYSPDTYTYSIIIHCFGKAGKLTAAYRLFCEMVDHGYPPSIITYNTMIDLHAKAGQFDMAMKLYKEMKEAGFNPDHVTYSIMMDVLGHSGHVEEAELLFLEMEQAGWTPDAPMFGLMVDLWGKLGNAEKAGEWFNHMIISGVDANVPVCNSLLNAYLRLNQYDSVRQVLECMSQWCLNPTLQTYTLLLSGCKGCKQQQQRVDLILSLKGSIEHPPYALLCSFLTADPTQRDSESLIRQLFACMHFEEQEHKRGFADCLIDFLHSAGLRSDAGLVWDIVVENNLYPCAVKDKIPHHWSVNLHVMSVGTAMVALSKTLVSFKERMMASGMIPERVDIITGWGRRSRVAGASLVKRAVENFLKSMCSPFHIDGSNLGCLVSGGKPLFHWLTRPQVGQMLAF